MKKKLVNVLGLTMLVLGMTACGSTNAEQTENTASEAESTEAAEENEETEEVTEEAAPAEVLDTFKLD